MMYLQTENELIPYELGDEINPPSKVLFLVSDAQLQESELEFTLEYVYDYEFPIQGDTEDIVVPFVAEIENKFYYSLPWRTISAINQTVSGGSGDMPTPTPSPSPTPIPIPYFVSNGGNDNQSVNGDENEPFKTLDYAISRITNQDTIYFKEGSYEFDETEISNTGLALQGYNNENVIFDGTRSIYDLKDNSTNNGNWEEYDTTIVTDDNQTISNKKIYRIKLNQDVEIWQLFYRRKEVINARWPSAQWDDDSVYDFNKWGHGYYNINSNEDITDNSSNVIGNGTGSHYYYENGEIVDVAHDGISLYNFVTTQQGIDSTFDISDSLINLNVGSFKSYTKVVNSQTLDNTNEVIRLSYDDVGLWKEKHHYYYLENKLEYLNSENEWFFDNDSKYLYVWLENDDIPNSQDIRAKVQSYSLNVTADNVSIENINFFSTTIKGNNADNLKVRNCNFMYSSCYAHMLNQINYGTPINPLDDEVFDNQTNIRSSSNVVISKCAFRYTDGSVLETTGGNTTIEDCYFNYIDKTVCNLSSVMTTLRLSGSNNLIKNNTIHKTAASSTLNSGNEAIIEYNDLYESGYLQSDGAMIHSMVNQQPNVKIRYNWVHDTIKYGIRFDGNGEGYHGYIHHNIGWNCEGGIMVKGGELDAEGNSVGGHFVYNNTFFNSVEKNDIMVLNTQVGININYGSVVLNNLCESLSGHRSDIEPFENRIINSNNYTPNNVEDYLIDVNNNDFRPINDNLIVNAGTTSYTNSEFSPTGVDSLTADIGAMNYNGNSWEAGITWNDSSLSDSEYATINKFNFYNELQSSPTPTPSPSPSPSPSPTTTPYLLDCTIIEGAKVTSNGNFVSVNGTFVIYGFTSDDQANQWVEALNHPHQTRSGYLQDLKLNDEILRVPATHPWVYTKSSSAYKGHYNRIQINTSGSSGATRQYVWKGSSYGISHSNGSSLELNDCYNPTPTPSPTTTILEEEPIDEYIYDNMEAVSIIGGSDGESVVGWNDRSLTTVQGVAGVDGLSFANNIVTLTKTGRYYIKARTGAYKSDYMKTRISFLDGDYSGSNFEGPKRWAQDSESNAIVSESVVVVDITQTTTFKIQTSVQVAFATGLTSGGESTLFVQKLASADGDSSSSDGSSSSSSGGISAWGVFDGTANYDSDNYLPIKASENIESIKYISTGVYEVTMTNPMPTEHYSASVNCNPSGYGGAYGGVMDLYNNGSVDVPTASKFRIDVRTAGNAQTNSNRISFHVVAEVSNSSGGSSSSDGSSSSSDGSSSTGHPKLQEASDFDGVVPDRIIVNNGANQLSTFRLYQIQPNTETTNNIVYRDNYGNHQSLTFKNDATGTSPTFSYSEWKFFGTINSLQDVIDTGYAIFDANGSTSANSSYASSLTPAISTTSHFKDTIVTTKNIPDALVVNCNGLKVCFILDQVWSTELKWSMSGTGGNFWIRFTNVDDPVFVDCEYPNHGISASTKLFDLISDGTIEAVYFGGGSSSGGSSSGESVSSSNIVTGNYTGNGETSQTIELGFRPAMVHVKCTTAPYYGEMTQIDGLEGKSLRSMHPDTNTPANHHDQDYRIEITDTGFIANGTGNNSVFNHNESQYYYYAINGSSSNGAFSGGMGNNSEITEASNFAETLPDMIVVKNSLNQPMLGRFYEFSGTEISDLIKYTFHEYGGHSRMAYFKNDPIGSNAIFNDQLTSENASFYNNATSLQDVIDSGNAIYYGGGSSSDGGPSVVSAIIEADGTITSSNVDWIESITTGDGFHQMTFKPGYFTQTPSISLAIDHQGVEDHQDNSEHMVIEYNNLTKDGVVVIHRGNGDVTHTTRSQFTIMAQHQDPSVTSWSKSNDDDDHQLIEIDTSDKNIEVQTLLFQNPPKDFVLNDVVFHFITHTTEYIKYQAIEDEKTHTIFFENNLIGNVKAFDDETDDVFVGIKSLNEIISQNNTDAEILEKNINATTPNNFFPNPPSRIIHNELEFYLVASDVDYLKYQGLTEQEQILTIFFENSKTGEVKSVSDLNTNALNNICDLKTLVDDGKCD